MKVKCIGCGAIIQSNDPNKQGYVDKNIAERKEDYYCKRCFNLKHYNLNLYYRIEEEDYWKNIDEIKANPGLICNIVDIFNLEETIVPNINSLFNTFNILLVVNKIDLYAKSININKIKNYLENYFKTINIKIKELMVISSFNKRDIGLLVEKINAMKNNKNVYFVGRTNVGKSTIINKIINYYTNDKDIITVSNTANTTLGNIYIPFQDGTYLVDTPGIINKKALNHFISKSTLEAITPTRLIRPKTFQLNPLQTLFIAGFGRLDFLEGKKTTFVTNFSNDLVIHRTKLENADPFYQKHYLDILKYPRDEERSKLGKIINKKINLSKTRKMDIVFNGLGYITVQGEGVVNISTFEKVNIIIRKAII